MNPRESSKSHEVVEVTRSSISALMDRPRTERMVAGALRSAIDAHGPITKEWIGSATKRVMKLFQTPDGRSGCPYCHERLRVNVGLVAENRELRRRLQAISEGTRDASE